MTFHCLSFHQLLPLPGEYSCEIFCCFQEYREDPANNEALRGPIVKVLTEAGETGVGQRARMRWVEGWHDRVDAPIHHHGSALAHTSAAFGRFAFMRFLPCCVFLLSCTSPRLALSGCSLSCHGTPPNPAPASQGPRACTAIGCRPPQHALLYAPTHCRPGGGLPL